jgi:hypothetical protein
MRIQAPVLVPCTLLALATTLVAQPPPLNAFHVYSGSTSFTSRGFLAAAAGEVLQGYPAEQFRGIGHTGAQPKESRIHAFGVITQDQDQQTSEAFRIVFRRVNNKNGGPDTGPNGVLARTGTLNLPTGAGTGPAVYSVTVNLGEGVVVSGKHTFFAGLELAANSEWTADGQSVHASAYTDPSSATGDPVRSDAPNNAWQVDANGVARMVNPRTWNMTLLTQRGAFQVGALQSASGDGIYGSCGSYPDVATQGLAFRLRDAVSANKAAAVYVSTALTGGVPVPVDGHLWINPGTLVMVGAGTLDSNGDLELKPTAFAPGNLTALKGFGNLAFQAVVDVGTGRFDLRMFNAHASNL